ncbi:hypothetical protein K1T71_013898 [Dendrolimus kikuchii]|uniref:Uncharacterized protein n=1 Tax=Dendrolimus kikuchii TaxID=765133 RepID=A0ACC1CGF8_9NEOP|nr:hypothetical protein K1T71_013898 [Dendrolimus kikuchii]
MYKNEISVTGENVVEFSNNAVCDKYLTNKSSSNALYTLQNAPLQSDYPYDYYYPNNQYRTPIGAWYKIMDSHRKQFYPDHCIPLIHNHYYLNYQYYPYWYPAQFGNSFLPKIYFSTTNSKIQNQKDIVCSNVNIPKIITNSHGKTPINNMQLSTENAGTSNLFAKNSKNSYSRIDRVYPKETLIDLNNFHQNTKDNHKSEDYEDITILNDNNDVNDYSLQPSITSELSDKEIKNTYSDNLQDYLDIVTILGFGTKENKIKTDPFDSTVNINGVSNEEYIENTNNVLTPIYVDDIQNFDSNNEVKNVNVY